MKYIDADRLKAQIKEIENEFKTGNYYLDNSEQAVGYYNALMDFENLVFSLQQEQDVDLEEFTQKMNDWKARYNHPDNIPIKATMAFTARMFYMYPKVAREWYDNLPKVTQD